MGLRKRLEHNRQNHTRKEAENGTRKLDNQRNKTRESGRKDRKTKHKNNPRVMDYFCEHDNCYRNYFSHNVNTVVRKDTMIGVKILLNKKALIATMSNS